MQCCSKRSKLHYEDITYTKCPSLTPPFPSMYCIVHVLYSITLLVLESPKSYIVDLFKY